MEGYFGDLLKGLEEAMKVAKEARAKNFDPQPFVEIIPAEDIAGRVEGIVGPKGIAKKIREWERSKPREILAFEIVRDILENRYGIEDDEGAIEQAVRTGVGVLTEGVLVAPTEGISKIRIMRNPDGSNYLSIYFAGPIRSAGGTVAALSVILADFARRFYRISDYRPTETEIERYVEEISLYDAKKRLQYKPPDDDIRTIVRNCPVCIDGDPTEEFEVAVHKGLERVETDRVRGGVALVVAEGIAQKAAKILKYTRKVGLDWEWLEKLVKITKKEGKIKPNPSFLDDLVAGRPIFSYPSAKGGFRLRYGRTRMSGMAAKALHPATMVVLDDFPAIGTQLKVERPGKGCVVTPCDSIEGPIVKLKDGSVIQLNDVEEARRLRHDIVRILFLGDILVSYGDFYKSNHPLIPGAYCEEIWSAQLKKASEDRKENPPNVDPRTISAEDALSLSRRYGIPLPPIYTYFWPDVTASQIKRLAEWLSEGRLVYEWFSLKEFRVENSPAKSILEELCVPHRVDGKFIVISVDHAIALLSSLGLLENKSISMERFLKLYSEETDPLELVNKLSGLKIANRAPTYIGARMGRPEKARERRMKPSPHFLFPVGESGGKYRSFLRAYKRAKEGGAREGRGIKVEVARLRCPKCGRLDVRTSCSVCGVRMMFERVCTKCGRTTDSEVCPVCEARTTPYDERPIDVVSLFDEAISRCKGNLPDDIKGVRGMISETKVPERLEKGILRSKNSVFVFRDGTVRFDATDIPLTHFYPNEIGTSVEELRRLGYTKDAFGNELKSGDQLVELKPQDMLLSEEGGEYFLRTSHFIDDLLIYLYGIPPFYNAKRKEDLVGHLFITLSPHTSCGVLGRLIGFTNARVGYCHPYMIAARRRNADGDEDSSMLLLDALINFSKSFLPEARGGRMDAPLVLTTTIDPKEVDDEVHAMEVCRSYPLKFYELCQSYSSPGDAHIFELVADRLGKENQYHGLWFTHESSSIHNAPIKTAYILLRTMREKVEAQFALYEKIRAVDARDAAERLILSHFLPDLYGNLRSFSQQKIRCVDCNASYRRAPLSGKCKKCGGKLVLTISKGSIEKYLKISQEIAEKFDLPKYLKQRLMLLEKDIASIFEDETSKQFSLAEFM